MPCGAKEAGGVYRPRHPQASPSYKLVERFFPQFEAVYEERYQERYGFWRPIIGTVVRKLLECGDLKHGFARACLCRTADRSAALGAARSFSFRFPARFDVSARVAMRSGRWRKPAGWPSMSVPRYRIGNSCSRFPSACGSTTGWRLQTAGCRITSMRDHTKLRAFELADQLAI